MMTRSVGGLLWPCLVPLCLLASGCTEDAQSGECPLLTSNDDCEPANADLRPHFITPLEIHTGANGRDVYQSVLVANFGDMTLSSGDENIACVGRYGCIAPFESGIVAVITAQSAGQTTLTVRSGSITETVNVNVAAYTTAQYDLGKQRYTDPANADAVARVACASCHTGQGGAPHGPLALAGKSDSALLNSIQNSKYPDTCENEDGLCDCTPSGEDCGSCSETDCLFNEGSSLSLEAFGGAEGDHKYNLTSEETVGIMAYIRAIEPEF